MLGKIKEVPLRTIWKNEAQDFTPWLAENVTELGAALGLELEYEDKEVAVGPYSADILAKDTGTGQFVVIENQLEKTNHDHLGKCITYSAILDASAVIWVASKFTEEHKKALDWLNDHTTDTISFYGVQIELIKIDDSKPAIKFNIQSTPNEVVRQAIKRQEQSELSETRKTQFEFWTRFKEALLAKGKISSVQTPRPQYWFDIALGKSGVHLSNTFNTYEGIVSVRVYLSHKQADEWLPYFEANKEKIESEIGEKLDWNPNPENKDKVIVLSKKIDQDNKENWDETIDWLVQKSLVFRRVFSSLVKSYKESL